jgi:hypothetical protein
MKVSTYAHLFFILWPPHVIPQPFIASRSLLQPLTASISLPQPLAASVQWLSNKFMFNGGIAELVVRHFLLFIFNHIFNGWQVNYSLDKYEILRPPSTSLPWRHGCMRRGGHGLPKVSLGPAMSYPWWTLGKPFPETLGGPVADPWRTLGASLVVHP